MFKASTMRAHPQLANFCERFDERLRNDAATLALFREKLRSGAESPVLLQNLHSCAHKLAGAAGIFGYPAVSGTASTLEEDIVERLAGRLTPGKVEADLDALIACTAIE